MTVRLMIVDDSEVVRVGLAAVLSQDPNLALVGQAATSEDAVRQAIEIEPDLVLLDVRIPEQGGIEAGRQILEALPGTQILFLSAHADDELVRSAILIGAHGYLLKEIDARSLIESIKRVAGGESLLDPNIRSGVLEWVMRSVSAETPAMPSLTPQEQRIVALVAEGKTNKEIAVALDLSPKTVKNYLHNVFEKLGIQRRSQAAALHAGRQLKKLPQGIAHSIG
jgi:DNA-binding NarL/FixJ family response regulator